MVTESGCRDVVGYYAVAAGSIAPDALNSRLRKGAGRHATPAILIARLAIDESFQQRGLGRWLLRDALLRAYSASNIIGARVVLVNAVDSQAQAFYAKHGFDQGFADPSLLALLVSDISVLLDG